MAAKLAVNQIGQRKANQRLQQDGPEHEMRRRLHRGPDIWVGEDRGVVVDADVADLGIGPVGAKVGKRQLDRPDQRKDIDCQQQQHRRRDKQPDDGPVRQAAHFRCQRHRCGSGDALGSRGKLSAHRCE